MSMPAYSMHLRYDYGHFLEIISRGNMAIFTVIGEERNKSRNMLQLLNKFMGNLL